MFSLDIVTILLTLPGILLALTIHEFSHAYSAYLLGDDTAKYYGRLTLNPLAHIDLVGFLMLIFFRFGWAKPVPINPKNFSDRRKGYFLVSIAGPLSNIVLAILSTFFFALAIRLALSEFIHTMLYFSIFINLVLAVFNLFPIPPLDGSKILLSILPSSFEETYYRLQKYTYILLFLLVYFRVINRVLFPIVQYLLNLLLGFVMYLV
ncbi:site-2 protease family protein [Clostridium formicaceticum]|uniref:Peptidase family M50 n=1 Tax=Clostridium formicaceticum TaxID=1497 RepID=A0AAC9RLM7_9CLOT|nr:site-2 protease family protein [Clostridium formicaceticum]AOY77094.1 site-2 protease family protein [Clostridium formicaceticum]ARE87603.1 Peptidase family M50 [Clostridium formicaceticum]